MKYLSFAIVYVAFFGMIAAAVYWTNSGWPLFALVITPSITVSRGK